MKPIVDLLVALAFFAMGTSLATAQSYRSGAVAEVSIEFPTGKIQPADGLVWTRPVDSPVSHGADAPAEMRLRLSGVRLPDDPDVRIEIADASGHVVETITASTPMHAGVVWTLTVPGTLAQVSIFGRAAADEAEFRIDRIAFPLRSRALESIFGHNDLMDISLYEGEHRAVVNAVESSVARLEYVVGGVTDTCTAFRVGDDLVQTSSHCFDDLETCRTATLRFGLQKNAFNALHRGTEVKCAGVLPLGGEDAADSVLLRMEQNPGNDFVSAEFRDTDPHEGEALFIVQHPGGEAKKLSIIDCARLDSPETVAEENAYGHSCDTKGGSSGSPVFDLVGRVVGQQRAGHRNPNILDQPSLATFVTVLAEAEAASRPIEKVPDEGEEPPSTIPTNARPLDLPVADRDVGIDTNTNPRRDEPQVSSPGSPGEGTVVPED